VAKSLAAINLMIGGAALRSTAADSEGYC